MSHVLEKESCLLSRLGEDILEVDMLHASAKGLQFSERIGPLGGEPAGVDGDPDDILVAGAQQGQYLGGGGLRMVLVGEDESVLAQGGHEGLTIGTKEGSAAPEHGDIQLAADLAGRLQSRRSAAKAAGIADDPQAVLLQQGLGDPKMGGGGPLPVEMACPEVEGLETEGGNFTQHGIEAFLEGVEGGEIRLGGGISLRPSIGHPVAQLTGDKIGGHEGYVIHASELAPGISNGKRGFAQPSATAARPWRR